MRTLGVATRRSAGKYAWSPTIQGTSACVGSISNGPTPMDDTNTTFLVLDEARHRPTLVQRHDPSLRLLRQPGIRPRLVRLRTTLRTLFAVACSMLLAVLLACEEAAPPKPTAVPAAAPATEPEPEPAPSTPTTPSTPTAPDPPPIAEPEPPPPAPTQPDTGFSNEYDPPAWVRGTWRGTGTVTGATLEITSAAIRFSWNTGTDYVIPASQVYRQHTSTLPAYTVFKRTGAESEILTFVTVSGVLGSCARTTVNGALPPASSCTNLIWRR